MRYQMRATSVYGTVEVYDVLTGNPHFRGRADVATVELARLNRDAAAADVTPVKTRKAEQQQRGRGGWGHSRSTKV